MRRLPPTLRRRRLPQVPKGDQVWQHSEACQQRVDADGNWLRQTDGRIEDKAIERKVEAMDNAERYDSSTVEILDHSTESVGGIKKVEALGALKLLSGGSASWPRSTTCIRLQVAI